MLTAAKIFQSGMILQREKPVKVWGCGDAGKKVIASVQGKSGETVVDGQGNWMIVLNALTASESELLVIECGAEKIVCEDVAVGEVWLAGGQSNMEFPMRYEKHYYAGNVYKDNARVRFFGVPEVCFDGQKEAFDYSAYEVWRKVDKDDLQYFSAVGYYFQSELEETLDVPVGIIGCNWGGTRACAWMDPETVEKVGKPWIDLQNEMINGRDMDDYWAGELHNPMNDRGNPFDPFAELMMPRTPSFAEIMEFNQAMGMPPLDPSIFATMLMPHTFPGCLYEHMLKSVAPYALRGFIWYQGESDDEDGKQILYKDMLTGLINDWRKLWEEDELPFIMVQLPGFEFWMGQGPKHYEIIRQCQQAVSENVAGVYAASISDAGEQMDIHPKNKKVVGHRLALLARHYVYGEAIACEAPVLAEVTRNENRIELSFDHTYGGLTLGSDEAVKCGVVDQKVNTIANLNVVGIEGNIPYEAKIHGDKVILTLSEDTKEPLSIEFAYSSWFLVNLYNQAGIPAKPFKVRC